MSEALHLLEVHDLTVEFATEDDTVTAVDGVSFHVDPGETLVVVGESGSGKSVTSLAVMRLIESPPGRIASGAILFRARDGAVRDLATLDKVAMRGFRGNDLGMIFQEPMTSLNPVYTIGDQIIEAIRLHQGKSGSEAFKRAVHMLELLGIPEPGRRMHAYPHQMSGGMRQRAMIAMALSCNPALLIADEPTTALDVTIQAQILELIKRLQGEFGMAVIFITHNLGVAAEIADRIMVMYAGRIVEQGPVHAIFREPRMPYTIGLLNSVPRLGTDSSNGRTLSAIPGNVPSPHNLPRGCAFHPRCAFNVPGICDKGVPPLEACGADHAVRCVRWRDVALHRDSGVRS
ncbi:MAG TPA: ABC transporter ATP-binding protein [Alphaproteobacteria bacterium]|nr:ABC transporter ATP-binding protein [Alphaproteobacteria bacterium]